MFIPFVRDDLYASIVFLNKKEIHLMELQTKNSQRI